MEVINIIIQILSLVGAMGLFLYGMKTMSEALQKLAGKRMRNALSKITSNPFRGILAGFIVTGVIQSSSATSIMLVSFVNAGLVSFTESLGVIFGANIGTTVTAWLISLLGFNSTFDIYTFLLPLIAISLPLFFSGKAYNKASSDFIMGFVLLFLGIYFFKLNIPRIEEASEFFHKFHSFSGYNFLNVLFFVGLGLVITAIFQSSSATVALTIILATEGWITLDYALAMVLGENVGTTVTANIAAIVANKSAKRVALAHFLFNAIGIWWVLLFFRFFAGLIHSVTNSIEISTGAMEANVIPLGISIFHSSFNIVNAFLFTALLNPFEKLCNRIIKNDDGSVEEFRLSYIDSGILSTSELSVVQASREIANLGKLSASLFKLVPGLLIEKNERKFTKKLSLINEFVKNISRKELDVSSYITKISQDELSELETCNISTMLKISNNIKNITEICYQMALTIDRKNEAKAWFSQDMRNSLDKEFKLIEKSIELMNSNLKIDYRDIQIEAVKAIESEITKMHNNLREAFLDKIKKENIPYQTGIFFNDLHGFAGKVADLVFNISHLMVETCMPQTKKMKKYKI